MIVLLPSALSLLQETAAALFLRSGLRPWYAFGTYCGPFHENPKVDPFFFNPDDFPWVKMVEDNYEMVREELYAYLRKNDNTLQPYFNPDLTSEPNCWRVIGLKFWSVEHPETPKDFPKTMQLFSKVPHLISVSFSQLLPGTSIKPHNGDTNAHMRCHLGLKVPASLPKCGFQVGDDKKSWEEGKVLMFCDAQRHTAFNHSDETRFICLFDVIRPEYADQQNRVCSKVLAALVMQKIMHMQPWMRHRHYIRRPIYIMLSWLLYFQVATGIGSTLVYQIMK